MIEQPNFVKPETLYLNPGKGNRQALLFAERFTTQAITISFQCPPKTGGGAVNLICHLLDRGTHSYPNFRDLSRKVSSLYGMEASWKCRRLGDFFHLTLYLKFVSPVRVPQNGYFDELWHTIDEIVNKPHFLSDEFPAKLFEVDKGNYLSSIRQVEAEPPSRAMLRAFSTVFAGDSMGRPTLGTTNEVEGLAQQDLCSLYRSIVEKQPVFVSSVGPIDPDTISCKLGLLLGKQDRCTPKKTRTFISPTKPMRIREQSNGESDSMIAFYSFGGDAEISRFEYSMAVALISAGSQSRVYRVLREEKGLAYGHYDVAAYEKGFYALVSSVLPGRGEEGLAVVDSIISDLCSGGVGEDELNYLKREVVNNLLNDLDSPSRLSRLLFASLIHKTKFDPQRSYRKISNLKAERLREVISSFRLFADYVAFSSDDEAESDPSGDGPEPSL